LYPVVSPRSMNFLVSFCFLPLKGAAPTGLSDRGTEMVSSVDEIEADLQDIHTVSLPGPIPRRTFFLERRRNFFPVTSPLSSCRKENLRRRSSSRADPYTYRTN